MLCSERAKEAVSHEPYAFPDITDFFHSTYFTSRL